MKVQVFAKDEYYRFKSCSLIETCGTVKLFGYSYKELCEILDCKKLRNTYTYRNYLKIEKESLLDYGKYYPVLIMKLRKSYKIDRAINFAKKIQEYYKHEIELLLYEGDL